MSDEPRFDFYEKVRVTSTNPDLADIHGKLSAVLGRAQNDDGSWGYVIHVYDRPTTFRVAESDLISTGEHAQRSDFYSGDSIRVSLDGEITGKSRRTTWFLRRGFRHTFHLCQRGLALVQFP